MKKLYEDAQTQKKHQKDPPEDPKEADFSRTLVHLSAPFKTFLHLSKHFSPKIQSAVHSIKLAL